MADTSIDPLKTEDLVVTRVFDAPVEQVWSYFVEPEKVKLWWGPEGFSGSKADMDVRVGGTSQVGMSSPEYGEYFTNWTYEEVAPNQRMSFIRKAADGSGREVDPTSVGMPPEFPVSQRHVVTFEPIGDSRTKLVFVEEDWPLTPFREVSKLGLEQCLDKIEAALTSTG